MWWEPLLGAVVGSAATAGATLAISAYLNRQRENRDALNALQVVSTELEENQNRINKLDIGNELPCTTRIKLDLYSSEYLTLGDWEKNKSTLAVIALRDKTLWDEIRAIYGDVFEAKRKNIKSEDLEQWLKDLEGRLKMLKPKLRGLEQELRDELGLLYFIASPFRRLKARILLRASSQAPS
jgi:hypothetical protein